ncbi:MAG TPA: Na(+)/H(+) antiporter subunit B [Bacteroidetes bacterium]|nr:Na(+)/H(+) antiporter subunit B [Bacteroidota bacterium]
MNSVILQIAEKYIRWLLLFFALTALLRGHHFPGGGFIAGLLAGLAVVFRSLAYSEEKVFRDFPVRPVTLLSAGLIMILLSFLPAWLTNRPFMTGVWVKPVLPLAGELKLGTPLVFDTGIFLSVTGVILLFLFSLKIPEKWK